ncbi:TetR/AcrR family transcriptional regulator [Acidicapsa acidisoli]|uniref:TetR/AcrR family transcriptional regulator n=1 Tax=Acidicapsa acidisoli TaxID=1615681 RepID=UPI0021E0072F|nr:TetR/AcrR family transcriptional regulator [Acidicapsa acidisoli]
MKPPRPNKHQLQSETTRTALLQAARKIFVREGFERAQIDDIAAEVGRTRGAVYTHFESKEDLFLSVLEQQMQGTSKRAVDFIENQSEQNPTLRLKALKKFYSEADDPSTYLKQQYNMELNRQAFNIGSLLWSAFSRSSVAAARP